MLTICALLYSKSCHILEHPKLPLWKRDLGGGVVLGRGAYLGSKADLVRRADLVRGAALCRRSGECERGRSRDHRKSRSINSDRSRSGNGQTCLCGRQILLSRFFFGQTVLPSWTCVLENLDYEDRLKSREQTIAEKIGAICYFTIHTDRRDSNHS